MKNIILTIGVMAFLYGPIAAQTINDIPISEINENYIQIVGFQKMMSAKLTISVDLGQARGFGNDNRIKDENGRPLIFESMVDALNFFSKYNYNFVDSYAMSAGNQNVVHFLLKYQRE